MKQLTIIATVFLPLSFPDRVLRLDGQEELTRRTGSAPGRAREKAPG